MRCIFLLFLLSWARLVGQAQQYISNTIPDSLLENANYVKQFEELKIEIISPSKVNFTKRFAYTILNPKGAPYGALEEYYSSFKNIESISGELYDARGNKIKSVKKKDIADVSWGDGSTFMSDIRYKEHDFEYREYPYTISYEITSSTNGLLSLPEWMPQESAGVSIIESSLHITYPPSYPVRYKTQLLANPDSSITRNGNIYLLWTLKNIPAQTHEPYQLSWHQVLPRIKLAPLYFSAQGYNGSTQSWKDYGLFIYQLIKGRDILPRTTAEKVHSLCDTIKNLEDKVTTLYKYMQENTRYISIQMGIGGWQPFDANFVATNKYGDCKALSNYMVALLKEANITSFYVEINAGDDAEPLQEDFPGSQANHVIVCVPNGKDSIWLECTNPYLTPGFNGSFTGNRKAILIREDGAQIVKTSQYLSTDNTIYRKINARLDNNGGLLANMATIYSGQEQEALFNVLNGSSLQEKVNYLNEYFDIPSYKIVSHEHLHRPGRIPSIEQNLKIEADNYAVLNGKRLFISPTQFYQMGARFSIDKPRKFPIHTPYSFLQVDTILIEVPPGYNIESTISPFDLKTKFGNFKIRYEFKNNTITVFREYERFANTAPPQEWPLFAKFMELVYKGDRGRITLIKE